MANLELATVFLEDIHLITENEDHLPSKNSLNELKSLVIGPPLLLKLYRWNGKLYYTTDFHEIALQKARGGLWGNALIVNANSHEEIVYEILRNSFTNKIGVQKLNQFRFELVLQLAEASLDEIQNKIGLTKKQIKAFSFHKDMSPKGKQHAEENRDLSMMNKIWSSNTINEKSPHIRQYLETLRIDQKLNSTQFHFIEKYTRSAVKPFHQKRKIFEYQINLLLSLKEPNERRLFKEIEVIGITGGFSVA